MTQQKTISPVDGTVYVERALAGAAEIDAVLDRAVQAQRAWRSTSITERAAICRRFCDAFENLRDAVALELTWQMGRPIRYAPNEVRGMLERCALHDRRRAAGARRPGRGAEGGLPPLRAA